jgi:hypothetical protein
MVDDQALGEPITVADGRVQATARLHAGSHVISASFLGSESFNPADSEHVAVNVLKSVPSVRLTVVDTVFDSITATAGDVSVMAPEGVPWAPTGTVTVHDSATGAQVGEADLVGTSGLTRVNLLLPKGAHRLFAVYGGDSDFESGISPVASAEVAGRAVKVDVWGSPSPVYQGEAFAVGGRVSTLATAPFEVTGSIQFLVDGIAVDGPVALTLAAGTKDIFGLTAGKHQLRAHFLGDAHFDPAFSDPLTIEVNPSHGHGVKVDAWAGPSPVLEGDTVTVGSRVVPNADLPFRVSGSVQFLVDGIAADGPKGISNGIASGELRGLSAGPHTVRAHFLGDSHFGSALSKPVTIQVNPSRGHGARVDVWAGPSPVVEGNTVTVGGRVARLADLPFQISGSVQFLVDGIAVDGPVVLVDGVGAAEARALAVGAHVVQAHYLGDAHFEPALSEPVTIQVNARPKRAPVSLTVAKTRSKHTGTIVVTAKAVPVVEGFNATGLTARFFANGKQVGRTVTDKRGAAVLTLRDNRLKLGENPIVARVYPVGDQWVSSVTATTVIKVNTRPAATVSVKAAPDPRTGQLVVNASIKPRVTGYAVAGRLFAVRAHGKTIATARADRRGRVVFIVPVSKLGRGLTPIVVDCFSGSPRYTKAKSRSYVVHVNGWGRITSVEVAK